MLRQLKDVQFNSKTKLGNFTYNLHLVNRCIHFQGARNALIIVNKYKTFQINPTCSNSINPTTILKILKSLQA